MLIGGILIMGRYVYILIIAIALVGILIIEVGEEKFIDSKEGTDAIEIWGYRNITIIEKEYLWLNGLLSHRYSNTVYPQIRFIAIAESDKNETELLRVTAHYSEGQIVFANTETIKILQANN